MKTIQATVFSALQLLYLYVCIVVVYKKEGVVLDSEEWRDKGAEVGERGEREGLGFSFFLKIRVILELTRM